jgi:electron transfer flavoprotein alpha/beta subunit
VPLPAVVTMVPAVRPRLAHAAQLMQSGHGKVEHWSAVDIGAEAAQLGAGGSLTSVRRVFAPEAQTEGSALEGPAHDTARALAARLRRRGLI